VPGNQDVARAALRLCSTASREEEQALKLSLLDSGIHAVAVDFGGEFNGVIPKIVERAIVAAKREGVIREIHVHEGAVAGAAREAMSQIAPRATGFNVGGKIAVAHGGEHLAVAVFVGIGLLYLDDVAVGLAHRAIPS